jgi:hypothetical protein
MTKDEALKMANKAIKTQTTVIHISQKHWDAYNAMRREYNFIRVC